MKFTDKVTEAITASMDDMKNTIHTEMEEISKQVTALAGMGMIAFTLVSIVAVSALVIATRKK